MGDQDLSKGKKVTVACRTKEKESARLGVATLWHAQLLSVVFMRVGAGRLQAK